MRVLCDGVVDLVGFRFEEAESKEKAKDNKESQGKRLADEEEGSEER